MSKFLNSLIALSGALLLASCFSWDKSIHSTKVDELSSTQITPLMQERSDYIKSRVFSKCKASGVFISEPVITLYAGRTPELAKRIKMLGITDAFLLFVPEADPNRLNEFSKSLSSSGINVWLYIDSPRLYAGDKVLSTIIQAAAAFSSSHPGTKGVMIYQRPDLLIGPSKNHTSNILFSWDEDAYGRGKDNDMLMKSALAIDAKFREALPPQIELMQMVSPIYDKRIKDGWLSTGSSADFMKICSKLCIATYFSDREKIADNAAIPLENISSKASAFIAVRTYVDIYGGADKEKSLSDKSWFKLVKDLESVINTANPIESFRGIIFYDYYGLEKMWEKPGAVTTSANDRGKTK